jgi:molybdate transport system ATP-binding protein
VHAPDLLVLDEPFSGLDASWQARMVALLSDWAVQGRTLVLATHSPEFMDELLTHGLILHQGRLVAAMEWPRLLRTAAFAGLFGPGELVRTGS